MKIPLPKIQLWLLVVLAGSVAGVAALTAFAAIPSFSFEVSMHSSGGGVAQVFYDIGRSIIQEDSVRAEVHEAKPLYRFALPAAEYRQIRFDPLDRGNSNIEITNARVVDVMGRTIRNFSLEELIVAHGVSKSEVKDGKLLLTLGPTDGDPIIVINPSPPLSLRATPSVRWLVAGRTFLLCFLPVLLLSVLLMLLAKWIWSSGLEHRWSRSVTWSGLHPGRVLLFVAIASTVLSCYPVVFFGKSFISPNNGTILLYDRLPTLPGYISSAQDDARGADIGAAAWFHIPYAVIQSRALLQAFEVPLWNRYDYCGITLLGQGQSMFGDPLNFLVLLGGGSSWAWDLKFLLAKILFAWGIGLTIFASTRHLTSSIMVTASSVFIGFFAYRYNHAAIFSVCYAPWILYCWVKIKDGATARQTAPWIVGLIGACWAEINSGTVKEAYMLLVGMNGCGLLILLLGDGAFWLKVRKTVHLLGAALVFLAISMPVWLTFLDALRIAHTHYNQPAVWSNPPSLLIGFFDDLFYSAFIPGETLFSPSTNFLTMLGVLLSLGYFQDLLKDSTYRAVGLSALAAAAMAFSVVPHSVIRAIPFVGNVVHIGNTFSCLLAVYALLIAGFGFRALWEGCSVKRWQGNAAVTFLCLFLLLSLYLGFIHSFSPTTEHFHAHPISPSPFFYGYALCLLIAVVALPFVMRGMVRSPVSRVVTVPLFLVCLVILHWRHGMHMQTPADQYVMNPQVRVDLGERSPAIDRILTGAEPFRVVGIGDTLFTGFSAALGLEGINGADPLTNPYFRELTQAWNVPKAWDWRLLFDESNLSEFRPLTDMLNVRYFLGAPSLEEQSGLNLVVRSDLSVYESPSVWPRAFFAESVVVYESLPQLVSLAQANSGRPFAAVERNDAEKHAKLLPLVKDGDRQPAVAAFDYKLQNNATSFKIAAPARGVVALTESYLRDDFRVTVNGKKTPYFRVNHAFKGFIIDGPGTYSVRIRYWPRNFTLSLWMAAAGTALLATYLFVWWKYWDKTRPAC